MELVVRGRRERVDPELRAVMERKLARVTRIDGRIDRVEIEVTAESRGRIGGGHRVEGSCRSGRRTYRASGTGEEVLEAFDRLVDRLERQISDDHRRRRSRLLGTSERVQSARSSPADVFPPGLGPPEAE